jgi:Tol biopolymer transport system component
VRDAALNGSLPSIEQMTERPDRYFPYRYGESVWEYIGSRWGDDVIGQIMNAIPNVGIERAFKRELGLSLEDLSEEWKDAMQVKHLPQIANLERARRFSQPLLTERRTGGEIFLAPALSDDGSRVAFLSTGSFLRGEVFIDLWLADGQTGKRIGRLVKSTTDPNFEELRLLYSQSSFSPDGRTLAFTAQRAGKDVLYLLDVRRRKVSKRFDLPLEGILSPSWSPDGRRIVFTGNDGGITDLYVVDADGRNFRQLTDDVWGDLQPSWSPDGRTIAFASERGPQADYDLLRYGKWRISTLDLETGLITVVPGQAGMNINPVWAPDGRSLIFVTDRTGIQNLFLYDLDEREHYQLTNVVGAVTAATEYSPAITWAKKADRLAYTYYEDGEWTVWSINNPRALKKTPYRDSLPAGPALVAEAAPETGIARPVADTVVVAGLQAVADSTPGRTSLYRSDDGFRRTDDLPEGAGAAVRGTISVAALLDSAALALPDTSQFKRYDYKIRFQPDYIARPSIGYAQDNWGRGVFGGTTIILSDMLGNNRLALSGEVNGRISEARYLAAYTNLSRRLQWVAGIYQTPLYLISDIEYVPEEGLCPGCLTEYQDLTRYIVRQAFGTAIYPFNRFTRLEGGARFMNIDRAVLTFYRGTTDVGIPLTPFYILGQRNASSINYVQPYVAWVSDNTLNGYTGPIFGRRFRFEVQPTVGTYQWVEYLADYRRYDPILFNFLTFSTRVMASLQVGPDGDSLPKYIGNSQYVRGYDRENYYGYSCGGGIVGSGEGCDVRQLLGSRVALANAELRFPLIRRFELGVLPIALPPLDGLVFYDIGVAWNSWNDVRLRRPEGDFDPELIRYPLRSWGAGLRLNLFGLAIVRWDYAIPLDGPERKGFWTWSLGPSF